MSPTILAPDALHVCIATGQNAANLIPLKQLQARRVLILETPEMQRKSSGQNLKAALQNALPADAVIDLYHIKDQTLSDIVQSGATLVQTRLSNQHVLFHISGGTKLMVLALQEQFRRIEKTLNGKLQLLYTDTHRKTLDWYDPQNIDNSRQEAMQDIMTLQDQLLAQGFRVSPGITNLHSILMQAQSRSEMSHLLASHAYLLDSELSNLTKAATSATLRHMLTEAPSPVFVKILAAANMRSLLAWSPCQPKEISFFDRETAKYFAGGWLEEYLLLQMHPIFKAKRYATSVKIEYFTGDQKTTNEFDGIATHNNRILLIECKTGQVADSAPIIYKLDHLIKKVGGSMGQALYISARSVKEGHKKRAKSSGIAILDGKNITNLANFLREWQQTGKFPKARKTHPKAYQ